MRDEPYRPGRGDGHTFRSSPERRCYRCNGIGHLARVCPSNRGGYQKPYQGKYRGQRSGAHVNLCSTLGTPQLHSKDMGIQCDDCDDIQVNLVTQSRWEFGEFPSVGVATIKTLPNVRVYPLQYVDVFIAGIKCVALKDSRCQIPIVSNRLIGQCSDGAVGKVELHGFGKGHTVQAPLVNLTVSLHTGADEADVIHEIPIVCAIADIGTTDYDVILPADVVRELQGTDVSVSTLICGVNGVATVVEEMPVVPPNEPENVISADSLPHDGLDGLYIPQGKRDNVSGIAHESVHGGSDYCSDFSNVLNPTVDVLSCGLPSSCIDEDKSSHVESSQHRDHPRLLDECQDQVTHTSDLCDAAALRSQTIPKFLLCKRRCYRVADALNPKVDPQIRALFTIDFVRASVITITNLLQQYPVRSCTLPRWMVIGASLTLFRKGLQNIIIPRLVVTSELICSSFVVLCICELVTV